MKKKALFNLLQNLFLFLAFYFVVRYLIKNQTQIRALKFELNWFYLFISFFSICLTVVIMTFNTQLIYALENIKLRFWPTFKINILANLYRYIPGGIWIHVGMAMQLAQQTNSSLKKNTKLRVLQVFFNLYFGLFYLFFVLPQFYNWLFLGLYFFLVLSVNPFLQFLNRLWPLIFKNQQMHFPKLSYSHLLKQALFSILFWFTIAFSYTCFLKGFGVNNIYTLQTWFYVGSAYVMAYMAGFLFLPAPSGFGVREFVMASLLSRMDIVLAVGISLTLFFRLLLLIRDLLLYFFSLFIKTD